MSDGMYLEMIYNDSKLSVPYLFGYKPRPQTSHAKN